MGGDSETEHMNGAAENGQVAIEPPAVEPPQELTMVRTPGQCDVPSALVVR